MSANATLLSDTPPVALTSVPGEAVTERHLAILDRLAEAGLNVALALEAQAEGGPVVTEGDVALALDRAARAVRLTLLLRAKLAGERLEGETAKAHRKGALEAGAARLVRKAIKDETRGDADRAERLTAGAAERLRNEDFGDLLIRPFGEAVADICRDLGLSPDWLTLNEDCHAVEAALHSKLPETAEPPSKYSGPITVRWLSDADTDSS